MNAFCQFLVTHKLNLRTVFAEQVKSRRISVQQLRDFCSEQGYNLVGGDFDVIVRFFAAQSGKEQTDRSGNQSSARESLDLGKMIFYTRRLDPNYAKDPSATQGGKQA